MLTALVLGLPPEGGAEAWRGSKLWPCLSNKSKVLGGYPSAQRWDQSGLSLALCPLPLSLPLHFRVWPPAALSPDDAGGMPRQETPHQRVPSSQYLCL